MFNESIAKISAAVLERLRESSPELREVSFTLEPIIRSDIPKSLLQYLLASLKFKIFKERKRFFLTSSYPYQTETIASIFKTIDAELFRTFTYSAAQFEYDLNTAVAFHAYHTVLPHATLIQLFFGDQKHRETDELQHLLACSFYHGSLKSALTSYFKDGAKTRHEKTEVFSFIQQFDREHFTSDFRFALHSALADISSFYALAGNSPDEICIMNVDYYLTAQNFGKLAAQLKRQLNVTDEMYVPVDLVVETLVRLKDEVVVKEAFENSSGQFPDETDEVSAHGAVLPEAAADAVSKSSSQNDSAGLAQLSFTEVKAADAQELPSEDDRGEIDKVVRTIAYSEPSTSTIQHEKTAPVVKPVSEVPQKQLQRADIMDLFSSDEIDTLNRFFFEDDPTDVVATIEAIAKHHDYPSAQREIFQMLKTFGVSIKHKNAQLLLRRFEEYYKG